MHTQVHTHSAVGDKLHVRLAHGNTVAMLLMEPLLKSISLSALMRLEHALNAKQKDYVSHIQLIAEADFFSPRWVIKSNYSVII